jgi:hypothetical protein
LILGALLACGKRETCKICDFQTKDRKLKVYNDVLNDLIVNRFYGYLGKAFDEHPDNYGEGDDFDTARYNRDRVKYHNQIFNDSSYFQSLCLDTVLKSTSLKDWQDYLQNSNPDYATNSTIFSDLVDAVQPDRDQAISLLNEPQAQYKPGDFHLCVARLIPYKRFYDWDIGKIAFSKIIFHSTDNRALLYYEYMCGGKCGFGEVLLVEEMNGHWIIRKRYELWIS